jgi:8-oxo-dGTP diphosphatase
MNTIHKSGAIILSGRKMLIVRPKEKPFYLSPGGKYEEGENPEACLKRELMEELSAEMKSFKHYKTYELGKAATSNRPLKLELYFVEIEGEPKPSSEIETIAWISRQDFEAKKYNLAPSFDEVIPDLVREGFL